MYDDYLYKTEQYKGYTIKLYYDRDPMNPREFANLGRMVCWHRRYDLGDVDTRNMRPRDYLESLACEHGFDPDDEKYDIDRVWEEIREKYPDKDYDSVIRIAKEIAMDRYIEDRDEILDKHYVIFNLYMYEHGGVALSLCPFNDPWDSGQVGFIVVSREDIEKEFKIPQDRELTAEELDKIQNIIHTEVDIYETYLNGEVFAYVVEDPDGKIEDACGGYYTEEEALECAKEELDVMLAEKKYTDDWGIFFYEKKALERAEKEKNGPPFTPEYFI